MIDELHIAGLGVIEDVTLRLAPGLTVVTGETGAGKTMLVTALQLLTGMRADAALVRAGADAARVEARIVPPPATTADWLAPDDGELVVSREIPSDGRSRARINGRLAPVSALGDVLGDVVEVHAQHEHVRLARTDVQRTLLDRYGGETLGKALQRYQRTHTQWREVEAALLDLEADARERARTIDRLTFEIDEISAAQLDPETDARLDEELELLEHTEELQLATAEAIAALGDGGASEPLGVAVDALRRAHIELPAYGELRDRVVGLAADARELVSDLRRFGDTLDADPERLHTLRERKRSIDRLLRKYGEDVAGVVAYAETAAAELASLQQQDADAAGLEDRRATLRAEAERLAADLSAARRAAAERLGAAVEDHLADLALPHARFRIAVEPTGELGPSGGDRITYLLAPNPGEPERPVAQAASGGERSRVALAIEAALADVDDAEVLVFDEVDAGIGGATAMAVGEKLARLAGAGGPAGRGRQVLCVTHLAQLAAFADVHHVVEKGIRDGRTVTTSRAVADDDRVAELSRMLGGDAAREAGREHARALLEEAQVRRAS